jgi:hypothetical protein
MSTVESAWKSGLKEISRGDAALDYDAHGKETADKR